MKKFYCFIIIAVTVCCSSCIDITERYTFKANGTCNVIYDFDMSRAVGVLMNLMPDSLAATPQFAMVKDTSMNLYSALPDSSQAKMSKEEATLAKASKLSILMNLKLRKMKVSIDHQSSSPADLEYYLQRLAKLADNNNLKGNGKGSKVLNGFSAQQLLAGQDCYAYQVTPHKFYRIVDKKKFNSFLSRTQSTFAAAKAMLIDMPYKVVLVFSKPVKKINNSKAIMLSADRKQVTLQTNMDEIIKDPNLMNLEIDF